MDAATPEDLYDVGTATLLASWQEYARGAVDAALYRLPGVAVAVFPREPERAIYNNALLERGLSGEERTTALAGMEGAYAAAGVQRFAAWVHEVDAAMRRDLERRGYVVETTTRAMGMSLGSVRMPPPSSSVTPWSSTAARPWACHDHHSWPLPSSTSWSSTQPGPGR